MDMDALGFKKEIWDLLRQITGELEEAFRPVTESSCLTLNQIRILMELRETGEQTVGVLGKSLRMAGGNISAMCKKLDADGFLERVRAVEDERVVRVRLSEKGRNVVDQVLEFLGKRMNCAARQMENGDMEDILRGLQKLYTLMEQMREDRSSALND